MRIKKGSVDVNEVTVFRGLTPLSPAKNPAAAVTFYVEKLGFRDNGNGNVTRVIRGDVEILFYQTDDQHLADWTSFRIHVEQIEALFEEFQAQNVVHPNGALETKPWGTKEFSIIDLDGVCITFFEHIKTE
jgi:catechol 2,3-dioxygenase-like lactoylglutathione lyase family enzyme